MRAIFPLLLLAACGGRDAAEDWRAWYDDGELFPVEEPLAFTTDAYGTLDDASTPIGDVIASAFSFPRGFGTNVAPAALTPAMQGCENFYSLDTLPARVTGVVTIHPRYYFKARGCDRDDEKYYGSYYLEDDSGGLFILGDSKVAHFDAGDVVTLDLLATRTSFDVRMVYVHDVVDVRREARPIRYAVAQRPFGEDDVGRVRRMTGTVVREPDTFGETWIQPDGYDGGTCTPDDARHCAITAIDAELNRRGVTFTTGERVELTGPVHFSFDTYSLLLMRVGQINRLDD